MTLASSGRANTVRTGDADVQLPPWHSFLLLNYIHQFGSVANIPYRRRLYIVRSATAGALIICPTRGSHSQRLDVSGCSC